MKSTVQQSNFKCKKRYKKQNYYGEQKTASGKHIELGLKEDDFKVHNVKHGQRLRVIEKVKCGFKGRWKNKVTDAEVFQKVQENRKHSTTATRQLSYRKEDRAMRPIYGCTEKF